MHTPPIQSELAREHWLKIFDGDDEQAFVATWMQVLLAPYPTITEAVVVLGPANIGPFRPAALWPPGGSPTESLVNSCEQVMQMRTSMLRNTAAGQILAQPIARQHDVHGVFAVATNGPLPERFQEWLNWGIGWLLLRVSGRIDEASARLQERLMTALDLMLSTMEEFRWQAASQAAVTELAIRLGCDRVAVGFGNGRGIRFTALSHSADFAKRIDLVQVIETAMNEAADQGESIVYPPDAQPAADMPDKAIRITREHQHLVREYGNALAYSVPFFVSDQAYGVFLFEWTDASIDPVSRHLADTMPAILGRVLLEKREQQLSLPRRLGRGFRQLQARLFGPRHALFKLASLCLMAAIAFLSVAQDEFRLSAPAQIEGSTIRVIVSPYDAYVATASVRAGQTVRTGEVLATLDDHELKLEASRWASQQLQYQKQLQDAEAQHDMAQIQIARAQMQQAGAELALANEQIKRASLRAPFDGIVVSGDLSQQLGGALRKGDTLFEVAPLDSYRVVLQVDEQDMSYVELGQQGSLRLSALPSDKLAFTITHITPVAQAFGGKNSFRVEANLDPGSTQLRPGMEGIGKVGIGQRRLIWIWTRRTIAWLRIQLWNWTGL